MQDLFWQIISISFLAVGVLLAIAAMWPPISLRRLIVAACTLASASVVLLVSNLLVFRLPTHLIVIAECKAYVNEKLFRGELARITDTLPALSHLDTRVLPQLGAACVRSSPETNVVAITGLSDLSVALQTANTVLEGVPFYLNWRANRVVLVGLPGGPLSAGRAASEKSVAQEYLSLVDRHRAIVEYRELGLAPDRALSVTIPVWRATPIAKSSRALRLDFTDDQIGQAASITLNIVERAIDDNCQLISNAQKKVIELPVGATSGLIEGQVRVQWPRGERTNRLVLLLGQWDPMAEIFRLKTCNGSWWTTTEVNADVTLKDGSSIAFSGATMASRTPLPFMTLYTPTPGSRGDQDAAAGWERNASEVLDPNAAPPGLNQLIQWLLRSELTTEEDEVVRWPFNALWHSLNEKCWFRGVEDLKLRRSEFENCLVRSRRLAVMAPDVQDVLELNVSEIDARIKRGELDALIAAPEYETAPPGAGEWARTIFAGRQAVSMPVVVGSVSKNGVLTRDLGARSQFQEQILQRLTATPFSGPAGSGMSCLAGSNEKTPNPGLFWLTDRSPMIPVQPPDDRPDGVRPELRLRGVVNVISTGNANLPEWFTRDPKERHGTEGKFRSNVLCDNPLKRTVDAITALEHSRLYQRGASELPRASIVVFDTNQPVTGLSSLADLPNACSVPDPANYSPENIRQRIQAFLRAGGLIIIQPIKPVTDFFDPMQYEAALAKMGGIKSVKDLIDEVAGGNSPTGVVVRRSVAADSEPEEVATALLETMQRYWNDPPRRARLFSFRSDDGQISRRNATCAADRKLNIDSVSTVHCNFKPSIAGKTPFASVLNRIEPVPEFFRPIRMNGSADDLISGRIALGDGSSLLRDVRRLGLGRSYVLGYSPFSRDQMAPNFFASMQRNELNQGLCYLYNTGTKTVISRARPNYAHGGIARPTGMVELERFALSEWQPLDGPFLDAISDFDPRTGGFTLIVHAMITATTPWHWQLKLTMPDGTPYPEAALPASLIFQSYDPLTGTARIRVEGRRTGWSGPLTISFVDATAAPLTVPALFPAQAQGVDLAQLIGKLDEARSLTARVAMNGSSASVVALCILALVMFSPIGRPWNALWEALGPWPRYRGTAEGMPLRSAPLFSLQAALTEWGTHPGQPEATRNAGVPAGQRQWRSGDSGRTIVQETLYSLVAENAAVPTIRPRVRLKSSSQAASVQILLDGTGALWSPRARSAPPKAAFAAALAAFLAGAVTLNYGRAKVLRVGMDQPLPDEPLELFQPILNSLRARPSYKPLVSEVDGAASVASLVYLVCDGLSLNKSELIALADSLIVEGSQLRVAAVVSADDKHGAMLHRDARSGRFEDDSETDPLTFLMQRDLRLLATKHEIERRGAQLLVLDADLTTSEVLQRLQETGFLN